MIFVFEIPIYINALHEIFVNPLRSMKLKYTLLVFATFISSALSGVARDKPEKSKNYNRAGGCGKNCC